MKLPSKIKLVEVGPRDGLQNESTEVPVATKVAFIKDLMAAGHQHVEFGALVSPKAVPAMAGSDEVFQAVAGEADQIQLTALVPNMKGLERAQAAGVKSIAVFTGASESFVQKNIGMSIQESLETFNEVISAGCAAGMKVRAYISTVWGCPYEGKVSPAVVLEILQSLLAAGAYEVSLGDTIGVATANKVEKILEQCMDHVSSDEIALHFHDTRGQALANILCAMQMGFSTFDSSAGGLGGCPYAPGASGNVATEDLLYMLDGMNIDCGVSLEKQKQASLSLAESSGISLTSKLCQV